MPSDERQYDHGYGTTGSVSGGSSLNLIRLPNELLTQVISHLPTISLAPVAASCKQLYTIVHSDPHWKQRLLACQLPQSLTSPEPFDSWENLFLGHYPFWFLPRHKVWFADGTDTDGGLAGQLVIIQYDHRTGSIMGYNLVGAKGASTSRAWPEKPEVSIHEFHPMVRLHLENPVIRLRPRPGALPDRYDKRTEREPAGLASRRSAQSDLNQAHRIDNHIMLAQAIAPELQHFSMRLWPPARLPAIDRVRQFTPSLWSQMQLSRPDSPSELNGTSFERPTAHKDVCESAFRMRKKLGGHPARLFELLAGGLDRTGAGVSTFATLPEDSYRPTAERPYQGIWIGDYAGHGCEFLLIRQKITREERKASEQIKPRLQNLFNNAGQPIGHENELHDLVENATDDGTDRETDSAPAHMDGVELSDTSILSEDRLGETGRLEAIKLTGDANIPRGEFTFVAEDIGKAGELYVAESAEFKDKRVVSSWGHIAARGFIDDVFIKADLILVSHDCLAQYWHEFGHVAFYRRVDIDAFLNSDENGTILRL